MTSRLSLQAISKKPDPLPKNETTYLALSNYSDFTVLFR